MEKNKDPYPEDPFKSIEESRLQRAIDAVNQQKKDTGITWSQYLRGVVDLSRMQDYAENPLMTRYLDDLDGWMGQIARAERHYERGEFMQEFVSLQSIVMRNVLDAMTLARVCMDDLPTHRE